MKFKGLVSIAAAASLVTISSAAVAQSVAPQPATEEVVGDSRADGSTVVVGILALAAIIGGIAIGLSGDSEPASP